MWWHDLVAHALQADGFDAVLAAPTRLEMYRFGVRAARGTIVRTVERKLPGLTSCARVRRILGLTLADSTSRRLSSAKSAIALRQQPAVSSLCLRGAWFRLRGCVGRAGVILRFV